MCLLWIFSISSKIYPWNSGTPWPNILPSLSKNADAGRKKKGPHSKKGESPDRSFFPRNLEAVPRDFMSIFVIAEMTRFPHFCPHFSLLLLTHKEVLCTFASSEKREKEEGRKTWSFGDWHSEGIHLRVAAVLQIAGGGGGVGSGSLSLGSLA